MNSFYALETKNALYRSTFTFILHNFVGLQVRRQAKTDAWICTCRPVFFTSFSRLSPLASATWCGPHPALPNSYTLLHAYSSSDVLYGARFDYVISDIW